MYLIDTNIHAAYLLQAYENDEETRKYLAAFEKIPLINRVAADFILNELELLLLKAVPPRFRMTSEQESELKKIFYEYFQEIFINFTLAVPSIQILKSGYDFYRQYRQGKYLSFTDCLILALAEHNNYIIFSKDKRLNETATQIGLSIFKI